MPTEKQILKRARSLIRKGWCQLVPARASTGEEVGSNDLDACQWCLTGAIYRALREQYPQSALSTKEIVHLIKAQKKVESRVRRKIRSPIPMWNDRYTRTQQEVIDLLSHLIEITPRGANLHLPPEPKKRG